MDVVPAPNDPNPDDEGKKPWKYDPFSGLVVDDIIWGRGAIDNKHNLISQLGAVEELLISETAPKFTRTMYIAIGHDEETGGMDGASHIAKVLKEEGVQLEFILDEGMMMVSGVVPGFKDHVALIGCSEKGNVSIELSVSGTSG